MNKKLAVALIGGSGAVGRELILQLNKLPHFEHIRIFTRRILPEWNPLLNAPNSKLKIHQFKSLDGMKSWDHNLLHGIDSCFCCMGGRTGRGVTEFYKTDYTYYVEFAELAKLSGVPHYSLISSRSVSSNSRFLYMRVKGQANDAILKLGLPLQILLQTRGRSPHRPPPRTCLVPE